LPKRLVIALVIRGASKRRLGWESRAKALNYEYGKQGWSLERRRWESRAEALS
jgi:hypothetical protein